MPRRHRGGTRRSAASVLLRSESLEPRLLLAGDTLQGDFNGDGLVNAADYSVWRDTLGAQVVPLSGADHSGDGRVGSEDYEAWRDNYGAQASHSHATHSLSHQAEIDAALSLVPVGDATHTVVASGNWRDDSVWLGGVKPTAGARVVVPSGLTLTVDSVIAEDIFSLRLDGTLTFATDIDTQLRVETLVSTAASRLVMGTKYSPIEPQVTASIVITDNGAIDRAYDPTALSRGLILMGSTEIHGAVKTSWSAVRAVDAPRAGDTTLTLDGAPTGWRVGDQLAIAGTKYEVTDNPFDEGESELVLPTGEETAVISLISGNTVVLTEPLQYDHTPPASDLAIHVANTTRNAFIRSEGEAVDRRGHLMLMHNRDAHLAYAGFYQLGRTDKSVLPDPAQLDDQGRLIPGTGTNVQGRYSVHFHKHGVAARPAASTVTGSALIGTPGWGYVNHSSHVDFVDNVSFDVFGAGFYTEAGDEIGSFVDNLAIKSHGTGLAPNAFEGEDFGHSGDGFWFQGASGLTIRGNVASGATGSGIIIYGVEFPVDDEQSEIPFLAENLPDPSLANGAEQLPVGVTWLTEVRDNVAYSSGTGFQVWYHRTPLTTDFATMPEQLIHFGWDLPSSVIENTTVWNSDTGVKALYNLDVHYRNVRVVNDSSLVGKTGFDASNVYNLSSHIYENLDIEGFQVGVNPSPNGRVTIDGGRFANRTDIYLGVPRQDHRRLDIIGDVRFDRLVSGSPLSVGRQNLVASNDTRIFEDSSPHFFLYYDQIILNYGEYTGQQLYREEQQASVVPIPQQPEVVFPEGANNLIPSEYIGLTNAQLQSIYGASFGGVVPPDGANDAAADGIVGLVGSQSVGPTALLPQILLGSDAIIAETLAGVRNATPFATNSIPDLMATTRGEEQRLSAHADLRSVFVDVDHSTAELAFTAESSDPSVVMPLINPDGTIDLSIPSNASGVAEVRVVAIDPDESEATTRFTVRVESMAAPHAQAPATRVAFSQFKGAEARAAHAPSRREEIASASRSREADLLLLAAMSENTLTRHGHLGTADVSDGRAPDLDATDVAIELLDTTEGSFLRYAF
ncbi:G8 domain protein [Planctomycetes bacterium MalM25]|nr:G8 domain protein [Planctomycetes bacterium MalM25]